MSERSKRTPSKVEDQLKKIVERLNAIESGIQSNGGCVHSPPSDGSEREYCSLPALPLRELAPGIEPIRERLVRVIENKWPNGTHLRYYFFENHWSGPEDQRRIVRDAFQEWMDVGIGISFSEASSPEEAEIRIGFLRGDGSWSYLGRGILTIAHTQRTMNFGWHLTGQSGSDTALHEIGHTLGFKHEHQNPFAGIVWREEEVYRYFSGHPNFWSRQKTYDNVLSTLDPNSVEGSDWDANSIMHYPFESGLIDQPVRYQGGLSPDAGLSEVDKQRARLFYPDTSFDYKVLKPMSSHKLNLETAEQRNFLIEPDRTKNYTIQAFGDADLAMFLLEDNNGRREHLETDDDSGFDRNATLKVKLFRGRKYYLSIRMYASFEKDGPVVMYW